MAGMQWILLECILPIQLFVFEEVFYFTQVYTFPFYILPLLVHSFIWLLFVKMGPSSLVEQTYRATSYLSLE